MRTIFLLLSLIALLVSCSGKNNIEAELQRLDKAIQNQDEFLRQRQQSIDICKDRINKSNDPAERYWHMRSAYEELQSFDSDSALAYAERCYEYCVKENKVKEQYYWMVQKSTILTSTGKLSEANSLLQNVRPHITDSASLFTYYQSKLLYHSLSAKYLNADYYYNRNAHFQQEIAYRDSICDYSSKDYPLYYQYKVWQYYFEKNTDRNYLPELEAQVLASKLHDDTDAINAFMLSRAYNEEGNQYLSMKYLIWSALAYVQSGAINQATETLQDICQNLLASGDVGHAYKYINYCSNQLSKYDNRIESLRIGQLQNAINEQYLHKEQQYRRSIFIFSIVLGLLMLLLVIALFFLFKQVGKVREKRRQLGAAYRHQNRQFQEISQIKEELTKANSKLELLNAQLQESNSKLKESNLVKEEYIGYAYSICSAYIDKLDKQRKTISRKIKAGQIAELANYSPSSKEFQQDMKDFYNNFDAIFLRIFPSFVDDMNNLLQEGIEISVKEDGHLSTELRVLALMRLGINDGAKIAEFLHCSVQSVYNIRRSIYNKLRISVKDFKEQITQLGSAYF